MRKSQDWEFKCLADISNIVNGGTPKTNVKEYWGNEHYWITPAEMGKRKSPYVSQTQRMLTNAGLQNSSANLLPPFSIILSTRAPIGHLVINTEPMAFNQGCRGLVPNKNVEHKYLYYFLLKSVDLLNDLGTGTTFKELSAGKLKSVLIPLPTLSEQKRIVAILDEVFTGIEAAIANTEKNLTNTRELFESYLNFLLTQNNKDRGETIDSASELLSSLKNAKKRLIDKKQILNKKDNHVYPIIDPPFGIPSNWVWCYLSDISLIQEGPGIRKHQYSKEGVQFLTVTNILEGGVDLEKSKKYISLEQYKNYSHFTINKGDIVTACSGGSWGKSAIYDLDNKLILNTSTLRLRFFDDLCNNKYLYYLTKMSYFKKSLSSYNTGQQPNYGYSHYSRIPIPLPPLCEQENIVLKLETLSSDLQKLETFYTEKLTSLNELKQSLLQKAFSGELTAKKGKLKAGAVA